MALMLYKELQSSLYLIKKLQQKKNLLGMDNQALLHEKNVSGKHTYTS